MMVLPIGQTIWLLLASLANGATIIFSIPASATSGVTALDPAPVGISSVPPYSFPRII